MATTLYVGSDKEYATINAAINAAKSIDGEVIIEISAGEYDEYVHLSTELLQGTSLTFQGETDAEVVMKGGLEIGNYGESDTITKDLKFCNIKFEANPGADNNYDAIALDDKKKVQINIAGSPTGGSITFDNCSFYAVDKDGNDGAYIDNAYILVQQRNDVNNGYFCNVKYNECDFSNGRISFYKGNGGNEFNDCTFNNAPINDMTGNYVFNDCEFNADLSKIVDVTKISSDYYVLRSNQTGPSNSGKLLNGAVFNITNSGNVDFTESATDNIIWIRSDADATKATEIANVTFKGLDADNMAGIKVFGNTDYNDKNKTTPWLGEEEKIFVKGLVVDGFESEEDIKALLARSSGVLHAVVGNKYYIYNDSKFVSATDISTIFVDSTFTENGVPEDKVFGINAFADINAATEMASWAGTKLVIAEGTVADAQKLWMNNNVYDKQRPGYDYVLDAAETFDVDVKGQLKGTQVIVNNAQMNVAATGKIFTTGDDKNFRVFKSTVEINGTRTAGDLVAADDVLRNGGWGSATTEYNDKIQVVAGLLKVDAGAVVTVKNTYFLIDCGLLEIGQYHSMKGTERDSSTVTFDNTQLIFANRGTYDKSNIVVDNGSTLTFQNGSYVNIADTKKLVITVNADSEMNISGSSLSADTVTNNGTIKVTGESTINGGVDGDVVNAAQFTGDGWVYMKSAKLDADTNIDGANIRFVEGESVIDGATINPTGKYFQVGAGHYITDHDNPNKEAELDRENDVTVIVKNNAYIDGGSADGYGTWVGTEYYEKNNEAKVENMTAARYTLDIQNSLAVFDTIHVSNDGILKVTGRSERVIKNEHTVWNGVQQDVNFYTGTVANYNGLVILDNTNAWSVAGVNISGDNTSTGDAAGRLIIQNKAVYRFHQDANNDTSLNIQNYGSVTVNDSALEMEDGTISIATDAVLKVEDSANVYAAKGVTNDGMIKVDGKSLVSAKSITGNGSIEIDAEGFSGVRKVVDVEADGMGISDINITVVNNDAAKIVQNDEGDIILVNVDTSNVIVNGSWSKQEDIDTTMGWADGTAANSGIFFDSSAFNNLADAVANVEDNGTVALSDSADAIVSGGEVSGKTVTITGEARVDWEENATNLYVGRFAAETGTAENGKLIFDNAKITASKLSKSKSTHIHVSGAKAEDNSVKDGELVIQGDSQIEINYLINRNKVEVKGTGKVGEKANLDVCCLYVHGRNADESDSGTDETAEMTVSNGAWVNIRDNDGMGIGHESYGILTLKGDSKFTAANNLYINNNGTLNVEDSTLIVKKTLSAHSGAAAGAVTVSSSKGKSSTLDIATMVGTIVAADGTTLKDTTIKGAGIEVGGSNDYNYLLSVNGEEGGTLTLEGENFIRSIDAAAGDKVVIGEGASFTTEGDGWKVGNGATWDIDNATVSAGYLSLDGVGSDTETTRVYVKESKVTLQQISAKGNKKYVAGDQQYEYKEIGSGTYDIDFYKSNITFTSSGTTKISLDKQDTAAVDIKFEDSTFTAPISDFINDAKNGTVTFDGTDAEFTRVFRNQGTVNIAGDASVTANVVYTYDSSDVEKQSYNSGLIKVEDATLTLTGQAFSNAGTIEVIDGTLKADSILNKDHITFTRTDVAAKVDGCSIVISDAEGKEVKTITGVSFAANVDSYSVVIDELGAAGTYTYKIMSGEENLAADDASFDYADATFKVSGESTIDIASISGKIDFAEGTTLTDSKINNVGSSSISLNGITFKGSNTLASGSYSTNGAAITLAEGGKIKSTGGRWTLGDDAQWDINGTIKDAKNLTEAEIAELKEAPTFSVAGLSLSTSGGEAVMDVDNAYVEFTYYVSNKNSNAYGGSITMNFTNSFVTFTNSSTNNQKYLVGVNSNTNAPAIALNLKDSVWSSEGHFVTSDKKSSVTVDNSNLTATAFGNSGTFTVKGGSVVNFSLVNGVKDWKEKGSLNAGTISIEASEMTIAGGVNDFYNVGSISLTNGGTLTFTDKLVNTAANDVTDKNGVDTNFADQVGNITIDATSSITAEAITGDGAIKVDAANFTETKKLIDVNAAGFTDDQVSVINKAEGSKADKLVFNNDLYITDADKSTLYVNSAYTGATGDVTSDGKIIDYNAFSDIADAIKEAIANGGGKIESTNNTDKVVGESKYSYNGTVGEDIVRVGLEASGKEFIITGETSGDNSIALEMRGAKKEPLTVVDGKVATVKIQNAEMAFYKLSAYDNSKIEIVDSVIDMRTYHVKGGGLFISGPLQTEDSGQLVIKNSTILNNIQISAWGQLFQVDNSTLNAGTASSVQGKMEVINNSTYSVINVGISNGGSLVIDNSKMIRKEAIFDVENQNEVVARSTEYVVYVGWSENVGCGDFVKTNTAGSLTVQNGATFDFGRALYEGDVDADQRESHIIVGSSSSITIDGTEAAVTFNADNVTNNGTVTVSGEASVAVDKLVGSITLGSTEKETKITANIKEGSSAKVYITDGSKVTLKGNLETSGTVENSVWNYSDGSDLDDNKVYSGYNLEIADRANIRVGAIYVSGKSALTVSDDAVFDVSYDSGTSRDGTLNVYGSTMDVKAGAVVKTVTNNITGKLTISGTYDATNLGVWAGREADGENAGLRSGYVLVADGKLDMTGRGNLLIGVDNTADSSKKYAELEDGETFVKATVDITNNAIVSVANFLNESKGATGIGWIDIRVDGVMNVSGSTLELGYGINNAGTVTVTDSIVKSIKNKWTENDDTVINNTGDFTVNGASTVVVDKFYGNMTFGAKAVLSNDSSIDFAGDNDTVTLGGDFTFQHSDITGVENWEAAEGAKININDVTLPGEDESVDLLSDSDDDVAASQLVINGSNIVEGQIVSNNKVYDVVNDGGKWSIKQYVAPTPEPGEDPVEPYTKMDLSAGVVQGKNADADGKYTFTINAQAKNGKLEPDTDYAYTYEAYAVNDKGDKDGENFDVVVADGKVTFKADDNVKDIRVNVTATDAFGASTAVTSSITVNVIDYTAPVLGQITASTEDATNGNVTVSIDGATDNFGGSVTIKYSKDGGKTWDVYESSGVTFETNGTVQFKATDAAGNESISDVFEVNNIDKDAPELTITATADGSAYGGTLTNKAVVLSAEADDAADNGAIIKYKIGENEAEIYSGDITANINGETVYTFWAEDTLGNKSDEKSVTVNYDGFAPALEITGNATAPTKDDVTLNVIASDSNLVSVKLSKDDEPVSGYTGGNYIATENGTYKFVATDAAGNVTEKSVTVSYIDKDAPKLTIAGNATEWANGDVTLTASSTEDGVTFAYSSDGVNWTTGSEVTLTEEGVRDVFFKATDKAGNTTTESTTVKIDKANPVLKVDYNGAWTNQDVLLTVTASDSNPVSVKLNKDGKLVSGYTGGDYIATESGTYEFVATDAAGKSSIQKAEVKIDKVAPAFDDVRFELVGDQVVASWRVDDVGEGSGFKNVRLSGGGKEEVVSESEGTYEFAPNVFGTFTLTAFDNAGNEVSFSKTISLGESVDGGAEAEPVKKINITAKTPDEKIAALADSYVIMAAGKSDIKIQSGSAKEPAKVTAKGFGKAGTTAKDINHVTVGNYTELKVLDNIANAGNIKVGNNAVIRVLTDNENATLKGVDANQTFQAGKNSVFAVNGHVDLGKGNDTIKTGEKTIFTADDLILGAGNDKITTGKAGLTMVNKIDFGDGKNTLQIGNDADLEAAPVSFGAGNDTFKAGNGADVDIDGAVSFGAGKNTLQLGKDVDFDAKDVTFGDGNDTFKAGDRTAVDINGAVTFDAGKNTLQLGKDVDFDAESVTFGDGNDTFKAGDRTAVDIAGAVSFGNGNNKFEFGKDVEVDITGNVTFDAGNDTFKAGNGADIELWNADSEEYFDLLMGAGNDKFIIGDNAFIDLGSVEMDDGNDTLQIGKKSIFDTDDITFGAGNDKFIIGNNTEVGVWEGALDMGDGNDKFIIGDNTEVNVYYGALDMGGGKDTLTIKKDAMLYAKSLTGVETINASKGAELWTDEQVDLTDVKGSWKNLEIFEYIDELGKGELYGNENDVFKSSGSIAIKEISEGIMVEFSVDGIVWDEIEIGKEYTDTVIRVSATDLAYNEKKEYTITTATTTIA